MRILILALLVALLPALPAWAGSVKVGIVESGGGQAELVRGFERDLEARARGRGLSIDWLRWNSGGNADAVRNIAEEVRKIRPAVVLAVGSPAAKALKEASRDLAIVFAGLNDPVGDGLVISLKRPAENVTGTRYFPPVGVLIAELNVIMPELNRIAVVRNAADPTSMTIYRKFVSELSGRRKVAITDISIRNQGELDDELKVIGQRLPQPQAVFAVPDQYVVDANLERIIASARELKLPVITLSGRRSIEQGALLSVSTEPAKIGATTGELSARILFDGARPGDVDIVDIAEGTVYVRKGVFESTGAGLITGYSIIQVP